MNILIIQDQEEVRGRLVFWLENTFGALVKEAASVDQAIDVLQDNDPPFDLVLFDFLKSPIREFRSFRAKARSIPCILALPGVGGELDGAAKENHTYVVNRVGLMDGLPKVVQNLVKTGVIDAELDRREFCKIRTQILLSVCPLLSDIYIRLSEKKFLKLFHKGDTFERLDFEKYTTRKGVEHLYLKKGETDEFIKKYMNELVFLLASKDLGADKASRDFLSAYEVVQELGARIGFTPPVQHLIKTQLQLCFKTMGASPSLKQFLTKINREPTQYVGAHSILTAQLSCSIANQMEWGSGSTFQKLNLAALLHDVTLENQKLAACSTLRDVQERAFTGQELQDFKDHPGKTAALARKFNEVPADVDTIIIQHHERPEGNGFPRALARTYIAPLSCVFIVAHDLAQFLIAHDLEGPAAVRKFLSTAAERYSSGQFRKVLKALESSLPRQPGA